MRFAKSICLAGMLTVGVAVPLLTACADNLSSLYVERALYLPAGEQCEYTVDLPAYQSGVLDLLLSDSYSLPVAVANQLQSSAAPALLRTETSTIVLEGVEVNLEGLDADPAVSAFSQLFSATVPAGGGSEPGKAVVGLDLVPSGAIDQPGKYLIHAIIFGHTLGGTPIQSGEFVWPLDVCEGCLRTCGGDDEVVAPCHGKFGSDYAHNCAYYGDCDSCP